MNKTIEISAQAAKDMIPCLESRFAWLEEQIQSFSAQRDSVKTTLAEVNAKLSGEELPLKDGKFSQRFPKGHGERVIIELLTSLPADQGLTMAQIEERSGVNHATVYRTLRVKERNKGRFVSRKGRWMLSESLQVTSPLKPASEGKTI